ncbi:MAG: SH3 domain-containing protein, partial [Anaerolineaceae bacterium]|nr:SH3 domain-containing protein [Anaerolineaceae bacterium]
FLLSLKKLSIPGYNFFLFALLGAFLGGIGLLLDSPIILIAAALCIPLLTPLMGIALSPSLSSFPFLLQSLASLLISVVFYFGFGILAGFLSRIFQISNTLQISAIIPGNWVGWVILVVTAFLCSILFVRYEINPRIPGILLAYLIYLPLTFSGFQLAAGNGQGWQNALLLAITYLSVAIFITILVFLVLGLHPKRTLGWVIFLISLGASIFLIVGVANRYPLPHFESQPPADVATHPESPPTHTPEVTTEIAFQTSSTPELSPTLTPRPEQTKTAAITQTSTEAPVWVTVRADNGAVIREGPGYEYLIVTYAQDGSLIQMLPETSLTGTTLWVKVIGENGIEGWILHALLIIPTPTTQP